MKEDEINLLSTRKTKDTFTVNGCGKFGESKIHLNKTEAYTLFVELYNWIEGHIEQTKQQDNEKIQNTRS